MAWTQAEYDTLKAAVASGVQTVRYQDRTVTYHSLEQMRSLLGDMERSLSQNARNNQRIVVTTYKGL